MQTQQLYDVRDIYCAAFAIAKGVDMVAYYPNERTGYWNFQFPAQAMQGIMLEWHAAAPQVDVRKFVAAEKYIRGLMNSQR